MIQFFPSVATANEWLYLQRGWKAVNIAPGHIAGSVLVLLEAIPGPICEAQELAEEEMEAATFPPPKRKRGRPPKVKDAQVS